MQARCAVSNTIFTIAPEDLAFYKRIDVPPPTLCPDERARRRWAWRPSTFYLRVCDSCKKNSMSWFSPQLTTIKAVCDKCYQSEDFDALKFGRAFDFSRTFFEQYAELYREVPKHMSNTVQNENCDFILSSTNSKDCYMTDETDFSRDCYFGWTMQRCHNIVEGLYVHDCEIGYQLIKAEHCYSVFCSQNIFHCSDSAFLLNCRSCKHCLFCTNLRNKEYHIYNQPVSKEEFQKVWKSIFTSRSDDLARAQVAFQTFADTQPNPAKIIVNAEDCEGNYITYSKNVRDCFCVDNSRDCKYSTDIHFAKDVYDVNIYEGELLYECNHVGPQGYNNLFSQLIWYSSDVFYSTDSHYIKNCFGCAGLKKSEFCIFNIKYSQKEYENLKTRIIAHMRETKEWGEFFPLWMAPIPYNHSMAQRFFPLSQESAHAMGSTWLEEAEPIKEQAQGVIPDRPEGADSDFISKVFACNYSGRKFRFIGPEIKFYKNYGLPLPKFSPVVRIEKLWSKMGPRKLVDRECSRCHAAVMSAYDNDVARMVLCERCYLELGYG